MANIKSIKYLTQDELKRLLGVIESKRDKAIFLVVYYHGLRVGEVGMIKLEDVDIARGRIRIVREKHSLGGEYPMHPGEVKAIKAWLKEKKNGKRPFSGPRLIYPRLGKLERERADKLRKQGLTYEEIGQQCGITRQRVQQLLTTPTPVPRWSKAKRKPSKLADNSYLFPSQRGLPISRFTLDKLMKQYGAKADIPEDKRHFHVLKHSIATHMLDAGTDIRSVQDWIGHKNIQNTVVYAQISNRARDDLAKKLVASPMIVGS